MARQPIVASSIAAFGRDAWDRCFPGELEGWDYHRAVETAGLPGFELLYGAIVDGDRVVAAAPAFVTAYRLDTTVQGPAKRVTDALARRWPRLLSLRLLCIGSPVTETAQAGFAPEVSAADKPGLLKALITELMSVAGSRRIGLIAVKDAPDADAALWRTALPGFQRMAGLPTAVLPLPYDSVEAYIAGLSAGTRKDLRRKRRAERDVRIERRTDISDVVGHVMALYEQTVARSDLDFERLPAGYFTGVLDNMAGRSHCVLYWHGGDLLAFNLVLESSERLIDKFVGTEARARTFNLYFLSWLENVRYAIARGIPVYQSGQAGYAAKLRLGSQLRLNWNYFRHRNPVLNAILGVVARLVRLDRFDPDIRAAVRALK
ncbi:MAG: GNAT family N-acetyltransferase [Gemmatimonas sp.]